MKKSVFLFLSSSLLFVSTAVAVDPGDTLWTRTYGGRGADYAFSTQQTTDGGFIVAGYLWSFGENSSSDIYLLKLDANGDTLWTRTPSVGLFDSGYSVQQTIDGGYMIAGRSYTSSENNYDFMLVKTDAEGDTLWTRLYDNNGKTDDGEFGQQTADGGYIIVGETYIYWGDYNIWLVKTDANGDTLWTSTYDMNGFDWAQCVRQTTDGGYIITGGTGTTYGQGLDAYLLKTDSNGDILWTRTYGGSGEDYGYSVQQTTDGGYIFTGTTVSFGAGGWDFYLVKTDADGDTLWTRTYGCEESDYAHSVQQTIDGGYIIAGFSECFGTGDRDFWLVKTNANGDTLWTRNYYGGEEEDSEYPFSVQLTTDGGYIVAGYTVTQGVNSDDIFLVRVAGEAQEPAVSVAMTPDNPPVVVPPGGSFTYEGTLTNNTNDLQTTDAWVMVNVPGYGIYGPVRQLDNVPLAPNQTRSIPGITQDVPVNAPPGVYDYIAYCGEYPSNPIDSTSFEFTVTTEIDGGADDWNLSGWFGETK